MLSQHVLSMKEKELQQQAHLRFGDRTVHARRLLIHERYRLALLVFALLFSAKVAQSLDILLLSFILLLQNITSWLQHFFLKSVTLNCNYMLSCTIRCARIHAHAHLSLSLGFLRPNGILLSLKDFGLVPEVGRMPGFLIQKVVTPSSS